MRILARIIFILPHVFLSAVAEERVCSSPPKYPGATLMRYSRDKAFYKCALGQEPYGGSPVVQCKDGQWGSLTLKCQSTSEQKRRRRGAVSKGSLFGLQQDTGLYEKSCGNAGELLHGYFKYEDTKAYPVCGDGYIVTGPKVIECGLNGWPIDLPKCEEGEVPVTCPAPKVSNSEMKGVAGEYNVSAVITIKCSPGFQIRGEGRMTCGSDGQWKPAPPLCVPAPSRQTQCGVPENIEGSNSKLAQKFSSQKSFAAGAKVYYTCDVGYVHSRGNKYRWCAKGQWSPLELQCRRRLCGSAGELLNGHYEYTGVEFGDSATAVCDEGFQLVGQATRNCLSRGWDGHSPVCEAMACDDPPDVDNAVITGYAEAPFQYRTVVTYRCLVGTLMGPSGIWCMMNGTWSSPRPQCKDITCATPDIPNAAFVRSQRGRYEYRDTIYIHCNSRYTLVGPSTITCDEKGQWAPELPKCKAWNTFRRG